MVVVGVPSVGLVWYDGVSGSDHMGVMVGAGHVWAAAGLGQSGRSVRCMLGQQVGDRLKRLVLWLGQSYPGVLVQCLVGSLQRVQAPWSWW